VIARLAALRDALGLDLDDAAIAAVAAASAGDPMRIGAVHEARRAADRAARRADGVYYTPPHLVDLVIERAVGATCAERGPGVRVVDPACGAGVFLVAALRRLEAEAIARGEATGPAVRAALAAGLAGIDIDAHAVALARLAVAAAVVDDDPLDGVDPAALAAAVAGIVCGDALLDDGAGGYDAVVGNPPWGQKGYRFAADAARRLRTRYACGGKGPLDPFALFVERAHGLVGAGGRWGLVLPDPILLKAHEAVRGVILGGSAIEWIADAGRAFRGVGLDVIVMVGRRAAPPPAGHRVQIWHRIPLAWRDEPPPARSVAQAMFERLPGRRFNLHLDEADAARLAALASLPRFGDDFAIHEGVHSGNRRAALFRAEPPATGAPLVLGKDELRPFRLAWAGRWVDLDPEAIDRAGGGYANLGRPEWFVAGKLVVRRTGDRIVAARDRTGLYVSNNAFVALPRPALDDDEIDAWLALLNSAFATWWFRAQVPRTGRAFAELKIRELVALPRPPEAAWRAAVPTLAALARAAEAHARGGEGQGTPAERGEGEGRVEERSRTGPRGSTPPERAGIDIDGAVAAAFAAG